MSLSRYLKTPLLLKYDRSKISFWNWKERKTNYKTREEEKQNNDSTRLEGFFVTSIYSSLCNLVFSVTWLVNIFDSRGVAPPCWRDTAEPSQRCTNTGPTNTLLRIASYIYCSQLSSFHLWEKIKTQGLSRLKCGRFSKENENLIELKCFTTQKDLSLWPNFKSWVIIM